MVGVDGDLGPDDVRSELVACKHYCSIVQLCIVEGLARVINGSEDFLPSLAQNYLIA